MIITCSVHVLSRDIAADGLKKLGTTPQGCEGIYRKAKVGAHLSEDARARVQEEDPGIDLREEVERNRTAKRKERSAISLEHYVAYLDARPRRYGDAPGAELHFG